MNADWWRDFAHVFVPGAALVLLVRYGLGWRTRAEVWTVEREAFKRGFREGRASMPRLMEPKRDNLLGRR